jgi:hypothetical protein
MNRLPIAASWILAETKKNCNRKWLEEFLFAGGYQASNAFGLLVRRTEDVNLLLEFALRLYNGEDLTSEWKPLRELNPHPASVKKRLTDVLKDVLRDKLPSMYIARMCTKDSRWNTIDLVDRLRDNVSNYEEILEVILEERIKDLRKERFDSH